MCKPRLLLASASPRRRELLAQLAVPFDVHACPLREPQNKPDSLGSRAWVEALAYYKARAVADRHPEHWVLAADTVVACRGQLLGKPTDINDARRMLLLQAGRDSAVITGVALVRVAQNRRRAITHEVTRVRMRAAAAEIEAYLAGDGWRGKAGAYGIQEGGDRLVERVDGSFSNVVGLPIERVRCLIQAVGYLPPGRGEAGSLNGPS